MTSRILALASLAAAVLALATAPAVAASNAPKYYVALGDSLATGAQPAVSGVLNHLRAANGTNRGYVDVLYARERAQDGNLQLRNFGCGGETTTSMIEGGNPTCGYRRTSQLAEALAFLEAHRGDIAFVTIDIGGNDLLWGGGVPAIAANLPTILSAVRETVGPDVPIVGASYYDPFVAVVWFSTHDLAALQAEVAVSVAFNDFLEGVYAAFGVPVADVESAFAVTDLSIQPSGLPMNVERACAWTWMCSVGDIHANDAGYAAMGEAFADVLDS
jgi:lysophospholipase L1-like esterase